MQSKDRKLPKIGAKRYGHRSHSKSDRMIRQLAKTGFFDRKIAKEKEKYTK